MVERDFDNVFMLSGGKSVSYYIINYFLGMKVLYKTFPESFMTGELPLSCYPTPPSTKKSSRLSAGGKQKILFDSVCGSLKDSFTVEGNNYCIRWNLHTKYRFISNTTEIR